MGHLPTAFIILFCLLTVIRLIHWDKSQRTSKISRTDRHVLSRANSMVWVMTRVLLVTFVVIFALSHSSGYFEWMNRFVVPIAPAIRWAGVIVAVFGLAGLNWAHLALGNFFSTGLSVVEDHSLVTSGPYHFVRHPMYSALILFFTGSAIASAHWITGGLCCLVALFLVARVRREERLMAACFGDSYDSYRLKTGCFIPRMPIRANRTVVIKSD